MFGWAFDNENKDNLDVLGEVRLFKGLNKTLLRKLLIELFEKEYHAGEIIFSEGDNGKALYIVMSGAVNIVKKYGPGDKVLAPLGPGSYFGELALINESPRFATAVAVEKTNLLIMYKSYFDNLIKGNSRISSRVLLNLAECLSGYICGRDPKDAFPHDISET
jgi:CRP/FNR family transcriptional regulator, cyclic AMP receptor protein